jgi:hypothetical protein
MGKGRKILSMKSGARLTSLERQQPATRAPLIAIRVSKHAKAKQPKGK